MLDNNGEQIGALSSMQRRKHGSVDIETWTEFLSDQDMWADEISSTLHVTMSSAIQPLTYYSIHRRRHESDKSWFSITLSKSLVNWHQTEGIQQASMPQATNLLLAHTWLQHPQEKLCFRSIHRNYRKISKS